MVRELRDTDRGYRDVLRNIGSLAKATVVRVGILSDAAKSDSVASLVEVALIHEFGLGNVPERSFLRAWVDENGDAIKARLKKIGELVVAGRLTAEQGYGQFGAWAVGQIKRRIRDGIAPSLKPETIERKGSSTPLIDTGQLINSIAWKVEAA